MSKRPWKTLLEDMLEAIDKIQSYTRDVDFDDFVNTPMMVDAVIRNIEIMGEAAKNMPTEIQDQYPDITWHKI